MINIDYILECFDWNNSPDVQERGLLLARQVKSLHVFLQPVNKNQSKNIWDNCARVLSEKSDYELEPYLQPMMAWLEDLNWPGAECILLRLQRYNVNDEFVYWLQESLDCAQKLSRKGWEENLRLLIQERAENDDSEP